LARSITKAVEHVETLDGAAIMAQSGDVKSIAQTADLVHNWKDAAPAVKIRLDVLGATAEVQTIDAQEIESEVVSLWEASRDVEDY
jgi:hypothetical protein